MVKERNGDDDDDDVDGDDDEEKVVFIYDISQINHTTTPPSLFVYY